MNRGAILEGEIDLVARTRYAGLHVRFVKITVSGGLWAPKYYYHVIGGCAFWSNSPIGGVHCIAWENGAIASIGRGRASIHTLPRIGIDRGRDGNFF